MIPHLIQRHGKKPVIYLDQNWISNIAKAKFDEGRIAEQTYFSDLFEALGQGVINNRLVCPTSDFHEYEASLGSRVKDTLWRITGRLSCRLSFNYFFLVMHRQLRQAISEFVGQDTIDDPWWFIPFNKDPDLPTPRLDPCYNIVHVPLTDEYWQDEKRLRDDVRTPMHREYKKSRWKEDIDYQKTVAIQQRSLFLEGV